MQRIALLLLLIFTVKDFVGGDAAACCKNADIQLTVDCITTPGVFLWQWHAHESSLFGFCVTYSCRQPSDGNYCNYDDNYDDNQWHKDCFNSGKKSQSYNLTVEELGITDGESCWFWIQNVGVFGLEHNGCSEVIHCNLNSTSATEVPCPSLSKPSNGIINCSLGDDESPSYEDTCGFTCNSGYELTGSNTRTCQSNGSWNGNNAVCNRVSCPSLSKPSNGIINCSLGDDESPSYEDSCSFTCNTGYILNGSESRTCQSDGSWSGSLSMCSKVPAPIVSMTAANNYPTIGKSFSIECNVTVAKHFIGNVEIIWVVNGTVKRRVTDTVAVIDSQYVLHRDVYSMPPLHTSDSNTVYCCKAVIDAGEQLESNSSITLTIVADVISTKMITVSPTSTNVITLTPDSKHKDCSFDHAAIIHCCCDIRDDYCFFHRILCIQNINKKEE